MEECTWRRATNVRSVCPSLGKSKHPAVKTEYKNITKKPISPRRYRNTAKKKESPKPPKRLALGNLGGQDLRKVRLTETGPLAARGGLPGRGRTPRGPRGLKAVAL